VIPGISTHERVAVSARGVGVAGHSEGTVPVAARRTRDVTVAGRLVEGGPAEVGIRGR